MLRSQLIIVLALMSSAGWGQEFRGSIAGVVTDSSGAVVGGAKVTATQVETGTHYQGASTNDGRYTVAQLLPGTYNLAVESRGFKKFVREGISVAAQQQVGVNVTMQIGDVTESVNVRADSQMLDTENASQGQNLNMRDVEDLPLNGRTPVMFTQLSPGVALTTNITNTTPFDNGQAASFAMGGALANQNELLMDGNDDTQPEVGQLAYSPPQDAVQQVIVKTDDLDVADGRSGGGSVNVVTRSGTNTFHGSAYEFNEVSALAANAWLNDVTGKPKPVTRQNQYGFTLGGPLIIPKVYNGKNKLFYFFAFEGIQTSLPEAYNLTVPTAAERTGDFSALLALGAQYQLYNPFSAVKNGNTITRSPFPGNVIPPSLLSPAAQNILKYYPLPNQPGLADGADNYEAGVQTDTFNNELGRIDYNISDRHKLYWNFRHNFKDEYDLSWFNNPATGRTDERTNWGTTLDYVYTITPTLVLDTRLNWTRFVTQDFYGNGTAFDFASLGLPSSLDQASEHVAFPAIGMTNYTSLGPNGGSGPTSEGFVTPQGIYQITSQAMKVIGSHTFKFGGDLRQYQLGSVNYGYSSGLYSFGNSWANGPTTTSAAPPIGADMAALLLGLPTSGEFDQEAQGSYRADYIAFYVGDDWRLKPNLTLNLGVRYDQDFPATERYNRNVNGFLLGQPNPIQAAAQAKYAQNPIAQIPPGQFLAPGGLTFASPQNPDIYHLASHIFSPRAGFSWGVNPKTTIRAGIAVFEAPQNITTSVMNQTGFSTISQVVSTQNNYLSPYATLANPFPTGLQSPQTLNATTALGQSVSFDNPNVLNGYMLRWNFDVQRQLTPNLLLEVGYEGNHGIHLPENQALNNLPIGYLSTAPVRNQSVINQLSASVANPFQGLFPNSTVGLNTASTTTVGQLLLPYPEYGSVTEDMVNDESSRYEMAFIEIRKRLSYGLQVQGSYTHSKLMSDFRLNPQTPLQYEISPQDRSDRVVVSATYDLPFGKGKTLFASAGPVLNRVVSGWVLNSISTWQSGAPVAWGNAIYFGVPINWNPGNTLHSFNVAAFDRASADQLADNVRTFPEYFNNLRSASYSNEDFSVLKNTPITDRVSFQLRFEFFNFFNTPTYAAPNVTPTGSAFGQITADQTKQNMREVQIGGYVRW